MPFETAVIHETYSLSFRLALAFLFVYGPLSILREVAAWRAKLPVSMAALAEIAVPMFVGLSTTWIGCHNLAKGYRISGGGALSSAAGAAEAQLPLFLAAVLGALLGSSFLIRVLTMPPALSAAAGLTVSLGVTAALVVFTAGELLFCAHVQTHGVAETNLEYLAGVNAVVCLLLAVVFGVVLARRPKGVVSVPAVLALFVVTAVTAGVVWYHLDRWRHIAAGNAA